MNQTSWIIGGAIVIVLIAGLLYIFTGDSVSKKRVENNSDPITNTSKPMQQQETSPKATQYNEAVIKTSAGDITVKLYGQDSPETVANFIKLSQDGFYSGTRFHRVIPDFMIQGGDPLSKDLSLSARWGSGGPGYTFKDEFNKRKLVRGSLAMANSGPNTNGSQFFIVTKDSTPWLDGKHTNFGEVTNGMDVVTKIEQGKTGANDRPVDPVTILSIELK